MGKNFSRIKEIIFILIFINYLQGIYGVEPILFFDEKVEHKFAPPNSRIQEEFIINFVGGDTSTPFIISSKGSLKHYSTLSDDQILAEPDKSYKVSFWIDLKDMQLGLQTFSVTFSSFSGQIVSKNFVYEVIPIAGKFFIEINSSKNIDDVFFEVINKSGIIVDSGFSSKGVFVSDYLRVGEYNLKTKLDGFIDEQRTFILEGGDNYENIILRETEGPFLSVEPQTSILKFCPNTQGVSTYRLNNKGLDFVEVFVTGSSNILRIEDNHFSIGPLVFEDKQFNIIPLPKGDYEERVIVSHEGFQNVIGLKILIDNHDFCKESTPFINLTYRKELNSLKNTKNNLLLNINFLRPVKNMKIRAIDSNQNIFFIPSEVKNIKSGQNIPLLVEIIPGEGEDYFVFEVYNNEFSSYGLVKINIVKEEIQTSFMDEINDAISLIDIVSGDVYETLLSGDSIKEDYLRLGIFRSNLLALKNDYPDISYFEDKSLVDKIFNEVINLSYKKNKVFEAKYYVFISVFLIMFVVFWFYFKRIVKK